MFTGGAGAEAGVGGAGARAGAGAAAAAEAEEAEEVEVEAALEDPTVPARRRLHLTVQMPGSPDSWTHGAAQVLETGGNKAEGYTVDAVSVSLSPDVLSSEVGLGRNCSHTTTHLPTLVS